MNERIFQRGRADIPGLVIDRLPGWQPGTLGQRYWGIIDNARRGEPVFHRGDIDEWFEGRARLTLGLRRPVELALLERPAADQRENPPGLRFDHDDPAADIRYLTQRIARHSVGRRPPFYR